MSLDKAIAHGKERRKPYRGTFIVCLLPARTDTAWFHDYCRRGEVVFIRGRLKFGRSKNSAPFPSMLVFFGKDTLQWCGH